MTGSWGGEPGLLAEAVASRSVAISERDFQRQVIDLAHALNWRVAHFRPALTKRGWRTAVEGDGAGFPDLILVRGDRLIVAELKSTNGRAPSPEQIAWLQAFENAGAKACVWRPHQLRTDIVKALQ